ncbi:unnamed protein product [Hymenolepis diminuta]|uniref:Uncharacterized protein n=1 Tax=Hymenolepis diminuta TaxID=6216 RepID=A0A564YV20_HYMDI|nr:unnamed protein product [Hymenolepis diminuta]
MVVAEAQLTRRCFGSSPVHTIPSFSFNRPVQLKHTYNYVITCILIHTHTHTDCRLSDTSSLTPF